LGLYHEAQNRLRDALSLFQRALEELAEDSFGNQQEIDFEALLQVNRHRPTLQEFVIKKAALVTAQCSLANQSHVRRLAISGLILGFNVRCSDHYRVSAKPRTYSVQADGI
jgi:hypothetical protein